MHIAKIFFTLIIIYMRTGNVSFQGINLSNADLLGHRMQIYKLTQNDRAFLEKLRKNVHLNELDSLLTSDDYYVYNSILKRSFDHALDNDKSSMLLSCDNIPCGIMVNSKTPAKHFVDYICTWQTEKDKKAPFGAQTLFEQMYKEFLNSKAGYIELYATKHGSAVRKYLNIGFKMMGGDNCTEIMRITRGNAAAFYTKLKDKIKLIPAKDAQDIDLLKRFSNKQQ